MPRYFFDTADLVDVIDHEGSVLPDVDAARAMAYQALAEMLRDLSRPGRPAQCKATVRDEVGNRLFTITGSLSEEAA